MRAIHCCNLNLSSSNFSSDSFISSALAQSHQHTANMPAPDQGKKAINAVHTASISFDVLSLSLSPFPFLCVLLHSSLFPQRMPFINQLLSIYSFARFSSTLCKILFVTFTKLKEGGEHGHEVEVVWSGVRGSNWRSVRWRLAILDFRLHALSQHFPSSSADFSELQRGSVA